MSAVADPPVVATEQAPHPGAMETLVMGIFTPGTSRRTFQVINAVLGALLVCILSLLLSRFPHLST